MSAIYKINAEIELMYDETEKNLDAAESHDDADDVAAAAAMEEVTQVRTAGSIAQAGDVRSFGPGGCVIFPKERGDLTGQGGRSPLPEVNQLPERIINGPGTGGDRTPLPLEIFQTVSKPIDTAKLVEGVVKDLADGKIGKETIDALSYMDRDQVDKLVEKINEQLSKQGMKLKVDDLWMIVCGDPKTQGRYFQGRHASLIDLKTGKHLSGAQLPAIEDFKNQNKHRSDLQDLLPPSRPSTGPSDSGSGPINDLPPARPSHPGPSDSGSGPINDLPPARPSHPPRPSDSGSHEPLQPSTLAEIIRRVQSRKYAK